MPRPGDRVRTAERVVARKPRPPIAKMSIRRRNDITLRPDVIKAYKAHAFELRITVRDWQNRAIRAFAKEVAANPNAYQPVPRICPTCGHIINRVSDGIRREHVSIDYEDELTQDLLAAIAEDYYHGILAHAFDAACCFYLGETRAPKRVAAPRA